MSCKAVIFDLDGVLTDTAEFHFRAWRRLARRLGIPFDEKDNEQMKGIERMASLEMLLAHGAGTYGSEEKIRLCEQKNTDYQSLITEMSPENILPGVVAMLDHLRQKNIRMGVASASRNAGYVLDRLGLTDRFDYIASANLIRHHKPDPEIFLNVAQALKVEPEDCIGIEDAVAGIAAIKAAGMYAVGIGKNTILTRADVVFANVAHMTFDDILN